MAFQTCRFVILPLSFLITSLAFPAVITLDGTYQGQGIYVQNPFAGDNTFCITEVYVNDAPFKEIQSSAFEITLSKFTKGQYVSIRIVHKNECKPRILNAEALRSKSAFEAVSFKADDHQLKWTTKNEQNEEPFVIERFQNNKWMEIGKVKGKGPEGYNNYVLDVNHYSGPNKYRIKQRDLGGQFRYSEELEYVSTKPPITFYPTRVSTEIFFSEKTDYEIYDSFGNLVKKGNGEKSNVADLAEGVYWINIDNSTKKFLKK